MKILLYDMGSYIQKDMIYFLEKAGYSCTNILYKFTGPEYDEFFYRKFTKILNHTCYDCVMSTNFNFQVAKICYENNIKYISWIYDSPIDTTDIEYYQYPTNYIFLFDRIETERICKLGVNNIYHMPLAVNTDRLSQIHISPMDHKLYAAPISFIGQFYDTPELALFFNSMDNYCKGFLDAMVDTQLHIYGYNFIEDSLSDALLQYINALLKVQGKRMEVSKRALTYNIERLVTRNERLILLQLLGKISDVHYYSTSQPEQLAHLTYGGTASYFSVMPKIFRLSSLNICPTLKSICSGIPLRALDIMGSQGTLFSNYQIELAENFIDGKDVIMYDSIENAIEKAEYYLCHPELLQEISKNGYSKVVALYNYPSKLKEIFTLAGLY